MAPITIKNLPDALYERLKAAARAHHRSINGEVIAALETSLGVHKADPDTRLAPPASNPGNLAPPPFSADSPRVLHGRLE